MKFSLFLAPTGSPHQVQAYNLESSSLELRWDSPLLEEQNGYIRHYSVLVSAVNTGEMFTLKTTDDYTTLII